MQWGMHNDGMVYFPIRGSRHGLLVQNNEYSDDVLLFPDGTANWNPEKTNKSRAAHGVSIIEIKKSHNAGREDDDDDADDDHDHDRRDGRGRCTLENECGPDRSSGAGDTQQLRIPATTSSSNTSIAMCRKTGGAG